MIVEIKLNEGDVQIFDSSLTQLPYYQVAELIGNINEQIYIQIENDKNNEQKV